MRGARLTLKTAWMDAVDMYRQPIVTVISGAFLPSYE